MPSATKDGEEKVKACASVVDTQFGKQADVWNGRCLNWARIFHTCSLHPKQCSNAMARTWFTSPSVSSSFLNAQAEMELIVWAIVSETSEGTSVNSLQGMKQASLLTSLQTVSSGERNLCSHWENLETSDWKRLFISKTSFNLGHQHCMWESQDSHVKVTRQPRESHKAAMWKSQDSHVTSRTMVTWRTWDEMRWTHDYCGLIPQEMRRRRQIAWGRSPDGCGNVCVFVQAWNH